MNAGNGSALSWERTQTKLGKDVAVGVYQLYFDGSHGTFMGAEHLVGFVARPMWDLSFDLKALH